MLSAVPQSPLRTESEVCNAALEEAARYVEAPLSDTGFKFAEAIRALKTS
jgi:hypothetical protein